MPVEVNTPADAVTKYLEREGFDVTYGVQLKTGYFPSDRNVIVSTDYNSRKDGALQRTGEALISPQVQVRVRHTDYPQCYILVNEIAKVLSALNQDDMVIFDFPDGAFMFASFYVTSGPIYMGRDPKPGELENFSLNGEVTLIPFTP